MSHQFCDPTWSTSTARQATQECLESPDGLEPKTAVFLSASVDPITGAVVKIMAGNGGKGVAHTSHLVFIVDLIMESRKEAS